MNQIRFPPLHRPTDCYDALLESLTALICWMWNMMACCVVVITLLRSTDSPQSSYKLKLFYSPVWYQISNFCQNKKDFNILIKFWSSCLPPPLSKILETKLAERKIFSFYKISSWDSHRYAWRAFHISLEARDNLAFTVTESSQVLGHFNLALTCYCPLILGKLA